MKTSGLKMVSSAPVLSPLSSFAPPVTICLSSKKEVGRVAMVTCDEETVLQHKSRQRARVLLPIPPPPGHEVSREEPM